MPLFDMLPAELRGHIFDKSDLRGYDVRARVCIAWRLDVHDYLRELEAMVGVPLPALRLRNEVDFYGIPYATTVQKDAILDAFKRGHPRHPWTRAGVHVCRLVPLLSLHEYILICTKGVWKSRLSQTPRDH